MVGPVAYFAPPETARAVRTLVTLRQEDVRRLAPAAAKKFFEQKSMAWDDLATPRELLEKLGSENGIQHRRLGPNSPRPVGRRRSAAARADRTAYLDCRAIRFNISSFRRRQSDYTFARAGTRGVGADLSCRAASRRKPPKTLHRLRRRREFKSTATRSSSRA